MGELKSENRNGSIPFSILFWFLEGMFPFQISLFNSPVIIVELTKPF